MNIVFFHRVNSGPSIEQSFLPLIEELSKDNQVEVFHVPYQGSNPIHVLKNILFIHKHATKQGINHITGDIHYGVLGLIGRKSVLTIHDDYCMRTAHRGIFDKIYKWVLWIFLPLLFADSVLCISPSTLKNIKKYFNSKKLQILPHHTFSNKFKNTSKVFNQDYPTFLAVGTAPHKNLESTFKALKGIKCKIQILQPMNEAQKKMAKEFGLDYINKYNITLDDVVGLYNNSDIVLFPSSFEGFGMPIIEAQLSGKPVITTDIDPMNWVAGDAASFIHNPLDINEYRNAIEMIINNEQYRKDLVIKGLKNVERFSMRTVKNKFTDLYRSLLNK